MAPRATKKGKTTKSAATKRKTAVKKAPAKKASAKKATAKKTTAKKTALSAVKESYTKSRIMTHISEETGLAKKEVQAVFDSLENIMHRHLKKRGPGEFTVPGLMKCRIVRKPATKARKGINPFTGEETMFKAKPARNIVKVKPLKKLKEMAEG